MPKSKKPRAKIDYVNESLRDGIKVLRLIIAAPTRGFTIRDLQRQSGLPYDFCRRACFTLEHLELARQGTSGTWKPGNGLRVLAARTDLALDAHDSDVLALAGSMRD